jgi:hypothetical protein
MFYAQIVAASAHRARQPRPAAVNSFIFNKGIYGRKIAHIQGMKKLLGFSLMAVGLLCADSPAVNPAQQIYDAGIRQTAEGKLAEARGTLQGLIDAYPHDRLALDARGAIDATLLFEEGQARVKSGKYETGRVAFETLIAVYPENPLAERARQAVEAIAEKEKLTRPVIKSLEFRDFDAIPADAIRAELEAREVRLSVGQPCRPKDLEQAKVTLAEILAEKGVTHVRIEAQTRAIPPDSVAVIFSVEKPRASLLRSPWRIIHRSHPAADSQGAGI